PYDEDKVMENIIKAGPNTIKAHLKHLMDHDQKEYYEEAVNILRERGIPVPEIEVEPPCVTAGCPGFAPQTIERSKTKDPKHVELSSELRQWPTQLHLLNPNAPYLDNADLLISADCAPFAFPNFHQHFIKGKIVINLCPKLDKGIDLYIEKLAQIFKIKNIKSITITRMEVPCCGGIEAIVQKAIEEAGKSKEIKVNIISIKGEIISEQVSQ
ncbi:MAG: hypothetical protein WBC20_02445, partial [Candidatus Aminicenantaceae bacterium]